MVMGFQWEKEKGKNEKSFKDKYYDDKWKEYDTIGQKENISC